MVRFTALTVAMALLIQQTSMAWCPTWWPGQQLERALVFHPTKANEHWFPPPPGWHVEDVWLSTLDGKIHAWYFPCAGNRGALLFCHGNAGNLSYRLPEIARLMRSLGLAVLIFDYPGYGQSEGSPTEEGCYAAADAAYAWLTQRHAADRIVIFGESLGGAVACDLACDLAARRPCRALVLVKTFASLPDMAWEKNVGLLSPLVRESFDSLSKIARCPVPVLIANGDRDQLIPLSQATKLYQAARDPKRFVLLSGSDHNDPLPPEFLNALAGFLEAGSQQNNPSAD